MGKGSREGKRQGVGVLVNGNRMAPVGSKFSLILPLESKGIASTCLCSYFKLSCFNQKKAILSQIWGCFLPPGPPILDQDGPCGLQIFHNTPP